MALVDEVRDLADRRQKALIQSHDYYSFTESSWTLIRVIVQEGRAFTFDNLVTGTQVDQQELIARTPEYIGGYLRTASLQHFVSLFEEFVFDLLRLWLVAHPQSLSRKQIECSVVLNAPDKGAIVLAIVDKELNELKYGRVADWFAYLDRLVHLGCPAADEVDRLAEIKASRDILVHNKGMVNATYVAKAGTQARFRVGERLDISEHYHRESWELIRKVVKDLTQAALLNA